MQLARYPDCDGALTLDGHEFKKDEPIGTDPATGLPGLVSLSFAGLDGHAVAADLDQQGFAVGTGSACSESKPEPSRALLAMGLTPREALGTVRISLGRLTRECDVDELIAALAATVRRQRG